MLFYIIQNGAFHKLSNNLFRYHHVAKAVAPKREALAMAQAELASTQAILDEAKGKLDEVEQGIATLQEKYTQCKLRRVVKVSLSECEATRSDTKHENLTSSTIWERF